MKKRNLKINDGEKAQLDNKPLKIGRITWKSWANAVLPVGDIIVFEREIAHTLNNHKKELETLGLSPLDFIKFVVQNFNEIRSGNQIDSFLLIVKNPDISNTAIVELKKDKKSKFYKIKSAHPMNNMALNKKTLLCANVR